MLRKVFRAMLFSLILIALFTTVSLAQSVTVVKDSGDGAKYRALPKNYIQIKNMDLAKAEIVSGSGYSITSGFLDGEGYTDGILIWTGKPPAGFGSSNNTNDADADLKRNRLPDVTIRYPRGAKTSDGTYYDVLLTISDVDYYLGKSRSNKIDDDTTLKFQLGYRWAATCAPPRKTLESYATAANDKSSGCAAGTRRKYSIKIVECGTSTPISSSQCPTMLMVFEDLDVLDGTIKKSASAAAKGSGSFSEGVELLSGWTGNAVIGRDSGDPANTRLVGVQTVNGNTRIKVDGPRIEDFCDATGAEDDTSSLWSGFICGVTPQGFSFYWTGSVSGGNDVESRMSTRMGGQPTVTVLAKRTGDGAEASSLKGKGAKSGVGEWHTNTHIMNSDATYIATPGRGISLESLKVDGANQTISDEEAVNGRSYLFEKLNKYPLPSRDPRTGQPLEASDSSYYRIEAAFRHLPKYEAKKDVSEPRIALGSDEKLHYQIVCDEIYSDASGGCHVLNDDLAGGVLEVDQDSVQLECTGGAASYSISEDGINITYETEAKSGIKPRLIMTYTASVNWEKYAESPKSSITNLLYGKNEESVGGDVTGNETTVNVVSDLKFRKKVIGKLRDTTKNFEFDVALSGLEPNERYVLESVGGCSIKSVTTGRSTANGFKTTSEGEATIRCMAKGGQGFVLRALPIGSRYRITEAASDHVASYTMLPSGNNPVFVRSEDANVLNRRELSTIIETLDKGDGVVTVEFTNRRDPAPVSGVLIHSAWPLAIVPVLMVLPALLIAGKRSRKKVGDK